MFVCRRRAGPVPSALYTALANALDEQYDPSLRPQMLQAYKAARDADPQSASAVTNWARALRMGGDAAAAIGVLRAALYGSGPGMCVVRFLLIRCAYRYVSLIKERLATASAADAALLHSALADAYKDSNHLSESIEEYSASVR